MRWRTAQVAEIVKGEPVGPDVEVDGASIDSRLVRGGELFVPLVARRDGHRFVADALAAGAAAYLTSAGRPDSGVAGETGSSAVVVADTADALAALGRGARDRLPDRVVGITGSTGKTSTKDMLGTVLRRRYRAAVSERSFNNQYGVPLTLANAEDGTEAAVVEMGARGLGHIAWLCDLARPTVGVVTNVGPAHTEMLGSPDGVARAKAELVESLPASGVAVLNADDHRVRAMSSLTAARVVTFGSGGEVGVEALVVDDELRPRFRLRTPWGRVDVGLQARGAHQAGNAAAAAAAALVLDVTLEEVAAGLAGARLSPWRMEVSRSPAGALVINDAYNANPVSTEAALRALASVEARRRIAVLGPMLELGELDEPEHRRIGALARELGVDRLLTVGAPAYGGEDLPDAQAAAAALGRLEPGDAVLVKGSRAAGLEQLAEMLVKGGPPAWSRS